MAAAQPPSRAPNRKPQPTGELQRADRWGQQLLLSLHLQTPPAATPPRATSGRSATPSRRERVEPTPQARGNQTGAAPRAARFVSAGVRKGAAAPQALTPLPAAFTAAQFQLDRQPARQLMQRPDQGHKPAQTPRLAVQPEPAGEFPRAALHGRGAKEHRSRHPGARAVQGAIGPCAALDGPGRRPRCAANQNPAHRVRLSGVWRSGHEPAVATST